MNPDKEQVKHAPATPLPWVCTEISAYSQSCKDRGRVFDCRLRTGTHVPEDANTRNAGYITHAANAYPRLVSALRMLIEAASDDKLEDFSRTSNAADSAADLLRELGEL